MPITFRSPPLNPKNKTACMSCRRYFIFHEDRYHLEYDGLNFETHYLNCKWCLRWVKAFKTNELCQNWGGLDIWNLDPSKGGINAIKTNSKNKREI